MEALAPAKEGIRLTLLLHLALVLNRALLAPVMLAHCPGEFLMPKFPAKTIAGAKMTSQLHAAAQAKREKQSDAVALASALTKPPLNDIQPVYQLVTRRLCDLKQASRRVRKTAPAQLQRILASVQAHGIVPILISDKDEIIDGHGVAEAARVLGLKEIQCLVASHLSPERVRSLRIALNRIGETGEWDLPALRLEFIELEDMQLDLSATGFSLPEIDIIKLGDEDEAQKAKAEEVSDAPTISMVGDLFALGPHRLLCGDSLSAESYDRLLGGTTVACVFSDPPYNCPIDGFVSGLGQVKHKDFAMGVGEMDGAQFLGFLRGYLALCRQHCGAGAVLYACMDWRNIGLLTAAGTGAGLSLINMAVWNKGAGGMGGLYRSAHELIAVFCNGNKPAINNVELGKHGRDRTNVWTYPGANRQGSSAANALKDHPTPKPVPLVADALLDVTRKGDAVLDPFMGSGATLMAAQKTGRIAYGIELDPKYIDVIIRRWQKETGKQAVHVDTGLSWSELSATRQGETWCETQAVKNSSG